MREDAFSNMREERKKKFEIGVVFPSHGIELTTEVVGNKVFLVTYIAYVKLKGKRL